MKKMLFLACMALTLAACEKDPDMNQLDADLVVYTDHDNNAAFDGYKTYFLPDSILEGGEDTKHLLGRMRTRKPTSMRWPSRWIAAAIPV